MNDDRRSADTAQLDGDHSNVKWWSDLTMDECAAALESDPVVVLPVAALEQHGPHLPLSTDADIGRGILDEALRRVDSSIPILVLPMQIVGASLEHTAYPGTLSLDAGLLERTIVQIGRSVGRSGARRLVLANSHGGNRATLDTAALRLRMEAGMLVVKASWFRFPRPEALGLPEQEWLDGLHGGAVETAMMLHLHPDRVRAESIRSFPPRFGGPRGEADTLRPEGAASFAWSAGDLNPDGAVGDATLATAELGLRLVEHLGAELAIVLRDAHRFPVEQLAAPRGEE